MGWLYGTWLGAGVRRVGMAGFTISGVSYLVHSAKKKQQQLPAKIVLNLDLTRVQLVERAPSPQEKLASKLGGAEVQPLLLRDTCSAIRSAAADDRVVGLVAQFGTSPNDEKASLAQCQELADAVAAFRAEKPAGVTIAHADAFSGLQYLLAASFESVYAQARADLGLEPPNEQTSACRLLPTRARPLIGAAGRDGAAAVVLGRAALFQELPCPVRA